MVIEESEATIDMKEFYDKLIKNASVPQAYRGEGGNETKTFSLADLNL